MVISFVPVVLLSLCAAQADSVAMTFEDKDPTTGLSVTCDRCSPGTYLRTRCSSTKKSECAPCPPGSFTEVWNHIGRCLRCGVCSHNQVVKTPCTADRDCECQCKPGYYYKQEYEMCVRHSECSSGQGVVTKGTPDQDTVCQICPEGTYADIFSAHNCTAHKSCSNAGLQLVLMGSSWHNSVCANCSELKDGADYLREILPAFFVRHNMNVKHLRRIVHKLPSGDGKRRTSDLNSSELHEQLNTWIVSARPEHIRELPSILTKTGVISAGERLDSKLRRIDIQLKSQCRGNEVEMV
uniref:TNFR-Cys domain-containing protein n=1 Tax=Amphilophus citrinellus TaxID=61819 RepID=A0A3Q0RSP9_AMPCI